MEDDDDIMDFFDLSKPFKRVVVQSGTFAGRKREDPNEASTSTHIVKREVAGTDYAQKYADAEQLGILEDIARKTERSAKEGSSRNTSFDELDDIECENNQELRNNDDIYEKYNCIGAERKTDLPIYNKRKDILKLINNNRVVVIEGETGCGKTTQVPQYILEESARRKQFCNIICTQPRRIAAVSIARRICEEKSFPIGSMIGYQVGLYQNASEDTRLLFCTTGVLLQKLISTKSMSQYTHVILDEVHERDQDMDFLLIVVRRFLTTVSRNTKVILMSATIDSELFSNYFRFIQEGAYIPAPILKIGQDSPYKVQCFYIDQLADLKCNLEVNYEDPNISEDTFKVALKLVIICNTIDNNYCDYLPINYLPSILIFLPGINEIDKMSKTLEILTERLEHIKFITIRLHSMISPQEQQQVFMRPPKGYRKIILATNIAESSITVPDVKYVFDFCLTKSLITDTNTNLSSLQLHWASKASCKQRAGRAGRVMNGRVYRFVSQNFYNNHMDEHSLPEMIRCPLEIVCLRAKMLNFGSPHTILGLALSPPNLSDICNTILSLKEAGALLRTVNGKYDVFDGDLSFVGRVMAALPLNIQLTRLIIFGYIFSILDDTIIIAAGLSVNSIFNCGQKDLQAFVQKITWSDGSGSDLVAILKAYRVWISMSERNLFENEERELNWARRYYINTKSIREMHVLVAELKERLNHFGIKEFFGADRVNWLDHERSIILKICIAGAFYPNYLVRTSNESYLGERDAFHTLCGYDPCNTVYFTGFDNNKYIGELYVDQIKALFQKAMIPAKNIKIRFCEGTEKIFVIFSNNLEHENVNQMTLFMPGRVSTDIYKALKMRYCNTRMYNHIKVFKNNLEQIQFAETHGYGNMRNGKWIRKTKVLPESALVVLPPLQTKYIRGRITHMEHCGKFWFQPISEVQEVKKIAKELSISQKSSNIRPSEIFRGILLAALYEKQYYRVRVINLEERSRDKYYFKVFFIDYGYIEVIDSQMLRDFNIPSIRDLPPRAFQCGLSGVQPSIINCPNGRWTHEAIELMESKITEYENIHDNVRIEIYSIVNGIASVIVQALDHRTINNILVDEGFAQFTEENYVSKMDHDLRERTQHVKQFQNNNSGIPEEYLHSLINNFEDDELEKPPENKCTYRLDLRGPNSPLEAKLHSVTRAGLFKSVKVERESVNSVFLDSDPQESRERLVVAASMSERIDRTVLTARSTTLMPNIPGFAALMCLIFCPTMEIRRDPFKNVYSSILAGLGYDTSTKKSIYEEHDVVLNLDVEIIPHDIELINQIRYTMDTLLIRDIGEELPKVNYRNRVALIGQIKNLIIKLLEKPRRFIEVKHDIRQHMWHQIDENDLLEFRNIYGDQALFPLHTIMRLHDLKFDRIYSLSHENKKLHELKLSNRDLKSEEIKCKLCDENIDNIVHLRIHLLSQLHRDREAQINFKY